MKKTSAIIVLIFISFILQSCYSTNSQTVETQNSNYVPPISETPQKIETEIQISSNGKIEFKDVSFTYNSQVFGEVKAKEVAEVIWEGENMKPDSVAPAHRYFAFFDQPREYSEMYIAVYPVKDFPRMYAVSNKWVSNIEKQIKDLERVLIDKDFRVKGKIPYLKYVDGSQAFQEKVKHFAFPSGQGILFLTHWDIEFSFIGNRELRYVFEGLTTDKKYYVLAEMPVSADFLPDDATDEFEGYKIPLEKLRDEKEIKKVKDIKQNIGKRLNKLPSDKYKPNLKYFEEIISSLKIEK